MTRYVFATMGTVVSLSTGTATAPEVLDRVEGVFHDADRRFSLYDPASELSRVAAETLSLADASERLRDTYADALTWGSRTLGAFTPHRPDGVIDLSGIVKALAIDEAGQLLDNADHRDWVLGCGGDVLERRTQSVESVAGIADPESAGKLLTAIRLGGSRRAVTTSGVAERGEHVWGLRREFAQVTVVADGIVEADVLATAILAGGTEVLDHVTATRDCDVFAIARDGEMVATPGIRFARPGSRSALV